MLLKDVLDAGELAKLVFYNDIVVGGVCCRVDASPVGRKVCKHFDWVIQDLNTLKLFQLYIMTLGCLAPYRRLGIGTKMLEHVLKVVQEDGNFASIFLHVQINNQSAIEFYKKFGFNIVETKEQYYKVEMLSFYVA